MKRSERRQDNRIIITGAILAIAVVVVCFAGFFMLDSYIAEAAERSKDRNITLSKEMQDELSQNASVTPVVTQEAAVTAAADPTGTASAPVKTVMPETQHDMTLTPTPDPQEYWATHPTPVVTYYPTVNPTGPATAWLTMASSVNRYNYKMITPSSSSATSTKEGTDPAFAFDDNTQTFWVEGTEGDGTYEILYLKLGDKHDISFIMFKLGNWTSYEDWYGNGRPLEITVWLAGNEYKVTFSDYMDEYCLMFSKAVQASELSFRIESANGGTTNDTYITDIAVYEEVG